MTGAPWPISEEDARFLERARVLARRGWGRVQPNPMVGCVVVRDGRIVGEGWHEVWGGAHAEVNALGRAGEATRGGTAYVSLEPCDHVGRTPPCTAALLSAGIRRVVYGAPDPGVTSGGGGARLRREGLDVVGPVLTLAEARRDNPAFFHAAERGGPYLALKLATTLDGKISAAATRTQISSEPAHAEVHRLRAGFDAILIGGATAGIDDPLLTVRGSVRPRTPPRRVVLDPGVELSPGSRLLTEGAGEVVVFTTDGADPARTKRLAEAGARVEEVPVGAQGGLDLESVLDRLWELEVRSVLCEGGGRLASAFLRADLVRRVYLFVTPAFLGPGATPAFPCPPVRGEGWALAEDPRRFGSDTLIVIDRTD